LRIKPDLHGALINWGATLSDQVEQKTGIEADRLFDLAGEKFAAALRIKADKHEALSNWSTALLEQAKQKTGVEADRLFALSIEKLHFAEAIVPGSGSYNLACVNAIIGNLDESRKWLLISLE